MPTVGINGIELYYERRGAGPRLLFHNGSGAALETSRILVAPFAERFDVVVYDYRGIGRTSIPPGPSTMAEHATDARGLLDHLGWERCGMVGISFGGMVAQEVAVTWPARIERLALLCTSSGGAGGSSYPLQELEELPPDERAARGTQLLDTRFTEEWLRTHADARSLVDMMSARERVPKSDEVRRGEAQQMDARSHHDVYDRLAAITCPTLVGCGRFDGIAPLANAQAIASRISGARLRVYEGGHAFLAQDPGAFPEILDFLAA